MGRLSLPKDHRRFDGAFQCAAHYIEPHGLTWLHLKAQAIQESFLDPDAVSPTGPRGIMQFTASTGKGYGLVRDEDFFSPEKSIQAGADHMRYLLSLLEHGAVILSGEKLDPVADKYERWQCALAAYNQGQGTLLKAVKKARNFKIATDDWACLASKYTVLILPGPRCKEVLNYVARIKKYLAILKTETSPLPRVARVSPLPQGRGDGRGEAKKEAA